jgi:predicted O-methyltransferase YrrM
MNIIEYIKENFKDFYIDNGPEHGILQGTKYAGKSTHCSNCMNTLVRMTKPKSILEIGSYRYTTTKMMSQAMDTYLSEDEGVIHSFDIKLGGYDGGGTSEGLPKRIVPLHWYPYKTDYDDWKFHDEGIVYKDFKDFTNEELFVKNGEILKKYVPENGYDLIFIDGDHSYEGVKKDWEHAMTISHKDTLIVIDNVWDIRLNDVRRFYDDLTVQKWDFESWNDEHYDANLVQDTAICLTY